ncbi:MAG: MerR family transcriptional regulator [Flavobacteriales bacterium]|nr:MerR family transcriptional regulator [Flavobacteriales bacterium]
MDRDYLDQYYREEAKRTEKRGSSFEDFVNREADDEIFRLKDVGITSRVLNHWNNKGLLITRKEEKNWKRFSFVDFVWLSIVVELRDRGTSLSDIRRIKYALNDNENLDRRFYQQNFRENDMRTYDFQMPLLQVLRTSILNCVSNNQQTFLVCTSTSAKFVSEPFQEFSETFIAISVHNIIEELKNKLGDKIGK